MWTCLACFSQWDDSEVEPQVRDDACFFVCLNCGKHNPLENIAAQADRVELAQLDA